MGTYISIRDYVWLRIFVFIDIVFSAISCLKISVIITQKQAFVDLEYNVRFIIYIYNVCIVSYVDIY